MINFVGKTLKNSLLIISSVIFLSLSVNSQNDLRFFITRDGDKLMENGKQYRFISVNIPNLHLVEDNMAFGATNEWRFPDEFEITDALQSVKQMGGRVVRIYVVSICRKDAPNPIPCHVRRPGEFNEDAFRALDQVLEIAGRVGVRVIIPLVDNWKWWGGAEDYAAWRGKPAAAFWTDADVIEDYKKTVKYVLNRKNTLTGTLYKNDKTILAWETGNELASPYSWTKQIAAFLKANDSNHLVWDGFYLSQDLTHPEALTDPNIDIVSSHHYPNNTDKPGGMLNDIETVRGQIAGKKAYVIGEFGFVPLADVKQILDKTIQTNISGAMTWSLRFHNRDGGFYWHSEGSGAGLYKAYHYPGFPSGAAYEEADVLALFRAKAFEIQGLTAPKLEMPQPPKLLPIKSVAEISWQGAVGATTYDVERATTPNGKWETIGADIDDSNTQYRPLFTDASAETGKSYYYRVRAKNSAGTSAPSNIVGAVRVDANFMVDELADFTKTFAHDDGLKLVSKDPRPFKEDASRIQGTAGSSLVYQTKEALRAAKILAFMENADHDFEFYVSADGKNFIKTAPKISRFPTEVNPYGYKLPVKYEITDSTGKNHFLKIVFKTDAQLSRVELESGK